MKHSEFFWEKGYLHLPGIFSEQEVHSLTEDLVWMMDSWAENTPGWSGPWRKKYMDAETDSRSKLIAMHDLQYYSSNWLQAVQKANLVSVIADLIGPDVELHHSTMHIKPPQAGHPFPMHQDWAFYKHEDSRYIDALVHLDDTCHENGEIRFLEGSHKEGPLEHIIKFADGKPCTPHLPTNDYSLKDTVPVPAKKGDVVLFNINTVHGSYINVTESARKLVRVGYRNPENRQTEGQSVGRPGLLLNGRRLRESGEDLFSTNGPKPIRVEETFAVG
ncbi:MAG: phytanoyl-CoA dioxygenase family protein [SAR324 cluster bacterium]|jgi:ectoine hydroxylase-related dioxygenase (phytanoyl-CoA dioxygenase family)|nr:phytanoyl-CoA dioxygenase family protein [SAR324 cluster bacterium]MEC8544458.1 phytanoyl-CoA dioxygenase family protein [SAR324 cluster bacterium]